MSVVGWYFFWFQKDMRVADEIAKPTWLVTGQTPHQMEQRCPFREIERRPQPHIITAYVEAQRNLPSRSIREELIQ